MPVRVGFGGHGSGEGEGTEAGGEGCEEMHFDLITNGRDEISCWVTSDCGEFGTCLGLEVEEEQGVPPYL